MYKLIVFGTGKTRKVLESAFNDNVQIVAYLDNDKEKWNKTLNEKPILCPNKIKELSYDYVIIASQFNDSIYNQLIGLGVENDKIFQYNLYYMFSWNDIRCKLDIILKNEPENTELLVSGISYAEKGINLENLCKKSGSVACFNQDLFYDYHLIKYLIENHNKELINLKYVIIGISYFSFEYDMSLSSLKYRSLLYYDAIGIKHHLKDIDLLRENKEATYSILVKIFKFNKDNAIDKDKSIITANNIYVLDDEKGRKQAQRDCNKNYPETVKENEQIFVDYIKLLKENNIKPIVVVFPVSKYYSKYFSKRIKDEFYTIINKVREENDFQFIDCFESDKFDDDDFYDVSHLNSNGATKFTRILNDTIKW